MDFNLEVKEIDRLVKSMKEFQGNTEAAVNEVLWGSGPLISESIQKLIPRSGRTWSGKVSPARTTTVARTLTDKKENLAMTVKTQKSYHYLYFPDDGKNTKRHYGNQHFFQRGGEAVSGEIVDRCVARLVSDFQEKMN